MDSVNKKITIIITIAVILVLGLILYASTLLEKQPTNDVNEKTYLIYVTETLWNDSQTSDGAFKSYKIKANDSIKFNGKFEKLKFDVVSANDKFITIKTNDDMKLIEEEKTTVDNVFKIAIKSKIKLSTNTTSKGAYYVIESK